MTTFKAIGKPFEVTIKGEKINIVAKKALSNHCNKCIFYPDIECTKYVCIAHNRKDNTEVIFVKHKPINT